MVDTEIRLIIFFAAKDGEALYSQEKQDRELTVSQIMSSLWPNSDLNCRKYGKPLHHSGILNQIPFDYTVKVTNRFKGLDLIECLKTMDGGSCHCRGDRDQDHLHGKEMQKSKMAV